ncbi:Hypothetical predicted protein, partial [Paramuricea clavata]
MNEPTRVTPTSASLIDLILTNKPENISLSGIVHLGISAHSLIFAIRKLTLPKSGKTSPSVREVRDFKSFVQKYFIHDISQLPWNSINQFASPNTSWQVWKSLFLESLDRHAPLRQKRLRQHAIPWITPQVKQRMRKRDFHKKQAIQHDFQSQWLLYKSERYNVNIEIRRTKSKYFCENAWSLINAISGRNRKSPCVKGFLINDTILSD